MTFLFGAESRGEKNPHHTNRRQKECHKHRERIRALNQAYKEAPQEGKEAIAELQKSEMKKLRKKKLAESVRKRKRKAESNKKKFCTQPFQFARDTLDDKVNGNIKDARKTVDVFLSKNHSDHGKDKELPPRDDLYQYPEPEVAFDMSPPKLNEVLRILKKARSKSAPGPNGIPYKFYKKCPQVTLMKMT